MSTSFPQRLTAKLVVDCHNDLGECPLWDDARGAVCWVDIDGERFWTFDPLTQQSKSFALPEKAGSFAICADSPHYLFAFEDGPAFYDLQTSSILGRRIFCFEPRLKTRLNDGRVDRQGRFVVGGLVAMEGSDKMKPLSSVYRINGNGTHQKIIRGVSCANSICFSLDGRSMFVTDSRCFNPKRIDEYQYFEDSKLPVKRRVFTQWSESKMAQGLAAPDGSVIDSDGFLWNAEYNGSRVVRYDKMGAVNMVIQVPEPFVTCVCFGGDNLDTLYITTAGAKKRFQGRGVNAEKYPTVGGLYAIGLADYGVRGCQENKFKGTPLSTGCWLSKL